MEKEVAMAIITFIGILFFPIFTLGCVLIHYDHPVLGLIAIIISVLKEDKNNKK